MARQLRLALILTLLAATTLAFVATEWLKLQPAPITDTHVTHEFAPLCDCDTVDASIAFRLRKRDVLTMQVIDGDDHVVRTLMLHTPVAAGRVTAIWNGRDDSGQTVRDGSYLARVELKRAIRTIILPNPIRVDTKPPHVRLVALGPRTISPDGDGYRDRLSVTYRQTEPGHPLLFVSGTLRVRGKFARLQGKLDWYGKVRGHPVRPGLYRVTLTARDLAGNLAAQPVGALVRVRYIDVSPHVIRVRPGGQLRIRISTDARSVHWRIGKRSGRGAPPVLHLRAPPNPGRYRLVVGYDRWSANARVLVVKK